MRRPTIACQRAVRSLHSPAPQHVWVPDDLLSLAVHRFFRFPCPHQKRHGSHIPGPLEARRRAAKRRMTVSAGFHPADAFPHPFSLGALFGFRASPQPSWRYEPPSRPQDTTPLDFPFSQPIPPPAVAPSSGNDPHPVPRDNLSPTPRDQHTAIDVNDKVHLGGAESPTVAEASAPQATARPRSARIGYKDAFAKFQLQIINAGQLRLNSRNKLIGKAFRTCHPGNHDAWKYNVMALRFVLDQGWYWGRIIGKQHTMETPPIYAAQGFSELLDCVQIMSSRSSGCPHLYQFLKQLAQSALLAKSARSSDLDNNTSRLIQQLWQSALFQGAEELSTITETITTLAGKMESLHKPRRLLHQLLSDPSNARTHVFFSVTRVVDNLDHFSSLKRTLSCVPEKLLGDLVPAITLQLAKAVQNKSSFPRDIYVDRLNTWLRLLQSLESNTCSKTSHFDSALAPIAIGVSGASGSDRLRPEILMSAIMLKLSEQEAFKSDKASKFIGAYSSSMWEQFHLSFAMRLKHLITKMEDQSLPYNELLELALPLVARHAGLDMVLRCVNMLRREQIPIPDATFLDTCIRDRMAKVHAQTGTVTEKQVQHNAYALRMCQNIISALAQSSSSLDARAHQLDTMQEARQFEHLFRCARDAHILPIAFRDEGKNLSTNQRIGLVHQLAYLYSMDTTRSVRQSFRSVAYLYHYLTSNSYPVGPLFSRAVTHVSITRPLSENYFVSARRLIWICRLVARVESESAAKQVENEFWIRRGALILHAKRIFVDLGGDVKDKAHVSTMKRLGQI